MKTSLEVRGVPELQAKLRRLEAAGQPASTVPAVEAGARVILDEARGRVRRRTGRLAQSLDVATRATGRHGAEATVGTDLPYAARIEFGFMGTDALGRRYHEPAHPYLRPAFDDGRSDAERAIADMIRRAIARVR